MRTAGPAAGPTLAVEHLFLEPGEMLIAGFLAFGRNHPADPLVASEIGQTVPFGFERFVGGKDGAKLAGRFVAEIGGRFRHCSGRLYRLQLEAVPDLDEGIGQLIHHGDVVLRARREAQPLRAARNGREIYRLNV